MGGRVEDPDRDDSADNSINGLIARLGSVARIQGIQNTRLTAINTGFVDEPDTDNARKLTEQTAAVRTEVNATLTLLGQIDAKCVR